MSSDRRSFLALSAAVLGARDAVAAAPLALYTFGDSILDCGGYNVHGVHPGQLLVRNGTGRRSTAWRARPGWRSRC